MDLPIDLAPSLVWPAASQSSADQEPHPDLVAAASAGSQEAFGRLIECHQDAIYAFCFRWLGNAEDAREACQDTFIRAWDALPRYRPRARFSTWLYQIALNLCRDSHKSRASRQRRATQSFDTTFHELPCTQPGPAEFASLTGDLEKLDRGIRNLPDSLRSAVLLSSMEGLSHQECARVLKCSPRAVEGRLYRARRELLLWWNRQP